MPYRAAVEENTKRFTLCARFFSEVRGPSYPNHLMLVAAQAPKNDDPRDPPKKWVCPKHCYDIPTFVEQFAAAGFVLVFLFEGLASLWRKPAAPAAAPAKRDFDKEAEAKIQAMLKEAEKGERRP